MYKIMQEEKRGPIFNARLKETGEVITLRKEPVWTLFQDFYADYRRKNFYLEYEFERLHEVRPIKIELDEEETSKYNDFCHAHAHTETKLGAIGGGHSLIITGTGLGSIIEARCNVCGKTLEISGVHKW